MKCQNCGAPLVDREKCEYCGSLLSLPLKINPYAQPQMDILAQNQIVTASSNNQWQQQTGWMGSFAHDWYRSSGLGGSVPVLSHFWWPK